MFRASTGCEAAIVPREALLVLAAEQPAIRRAMWVDTLLDASIFRTLQSLRKEGLIQLTARSLTVLDWDGLREVGDFDELYLHQQA